MQLEWATRRFHATKWQGARQIGNAVPPPLAHAVGYFILNYNSLAAYAESEIDFLAVLVIPEDTWYILPVREVLERRTLFFRPNGCAGTDPYAYYREAWHLLRQPDGLRFG